MTARISVVVITRNAENDIRACLETVKQADEIIVVDDLSTDRTVSICEEYGVKVFVRPKEGFGQQRNFGAEQASGDWILAIDADERVPAELWQEIKTAVQQDDRRYAGYYIVLRNHYLGKWLRHGEWYRAYGGHIRLIRKGYGEFSPGVHEKAILKGEVGRLQNEIEHFGVPTIREHLDRINLYTTMELEKMPPNLSKRFIFWSMVYRPIRRFVALYFYRQGFRDGIHGFLMSVYSSVYEFEKYSKYWEKFLQDNS